MMFALRAEDAALRQQSFDTWVHRRIEAGPFLVGRFVCPSCGGLVESRFVHKVWQWIHVRRCGGRK